MPIKNLSYPVPTIGRIAIGMTMERNGVRRPVKLDHFRITTQLKTNGNWVPDPVAEVLAQKEGVKVHQLRAIPIRFMFNDPDLNVRTRYEAFDTNGRQLCSGNGETCRRVSPQGGARDELPCVGPDRCEFGQQHGCKMMCRLNVQIDLDSDVDSFDPFDFRHGGSTYVLRTSGYNASRVLESKIKSLHALLGGRLVGVPLTLVLRAKSTTASKNTAIYYPDIVPAASLAECVKAASKAAQMAKEAGLEVDAYEKVMRSLVENGESEDTSEECAELAEFYPMGGEFVEGEEGFQGGDDDQQEGGSEGIAGCADVQAAEKGIAGDDVIPLFDPGFEALSSMAARQQQSAVAPRAIGPRVVPPRVVPPSARIGMPGGVRQ